MGEPAKVIAPRIVDETGGDHVHSGSIMALMTINAIECGPFGNKTTLSTLQTAPIVGMTLKGLILSWAPRDMGVIAKWMEGTKSRSVFVPFSNVRQLDLEP